MTFDHNKLDVYKAAIDFVGIADQIIVNFPQGRSYLANQLHRAATSIALNIAEGAGEFSPGDKARFYRIAKRSATECAAVLDVCELLQISKKESCDAGRDVLLRIVSMLISMVRKIENETPGTGTGTGKGTE